jgi:hypothetical protein
MAIQDNQPGGMWEDKPYPYQPGGTFLSPPQGQGDGSVPGGQGQGAQQGFGSMIGPVVKSLMSPSPQQDQQPQQAPPPATQSGGVPQQFGGGQEGDDSADENKQFAAQLGQGVLAASQAAAAKAGQKKKGMGGMGGFGGGGGGMDEGAAMGFAGAA